MTIRADIITHIFDTLTAYSSFTALSGAAVYRGIQIFDPDDDPPPLITILPRPEEAERTQYGTSRNTMPVDVSSLVRIGSNNPSVLGESVVGELITSVFSSIPTDAEDFYYTGGGIDQYPDALGQEILIVGISIEIIYQTDLGDPDTLT